MLLHSHRLAQSGRSVLLQLSLLQLDRLILWVRSGQLVRSVLQRLMLHRLPPLDQLDRWVL